MFARVSTYRTSPDSTTEGPSEDTLRKLFDIPGCKGAYFLNGTGSDKALSITLWESEEALTASQQTANKLRSATSEEQKIEILEVEEFKVTASKLPA
ncbi:antibiotic biosynthesis monooxygenase [Arthrobacter sp. ISL-5]|nr:antibiotic biosynthesis monooxygenase [Arthrobacter sp. ISL-5]